MPSRQRAPGRQLDQELHETTPAQAAPEPAIAGPEPQGLQAGAASPTPVLDAAGLTDAASHEAQEGQEGEHAPASAPGTAHANGAPTPPPDADDASGGDGDAGDGGKGAGQKGAPEDAAPMDEAAGSGENGGGAAAAGAGRGEGGGRGGGGAGGPVQTTQTPPVTSTATPTLGLGSDLSLPSPRLSEQEQDGILECTGRTADQHVAETQGKLSELQARIEGMQAASVARAESLAATVGGELSALTAEVQGGIATAASGIEGAYTEARGAVEAALGQSHALVDAATQSAISTVQTSLETHLGTLQATCAAARDQILALQETWTQPFTHLEQSWAQQFADAASDAATEVSSARDAIVSSFQGGGSAIDRAKGEKRAKAAGELVDAGVQSIRSSGPGRAREAIDSLGHAGIVAGFVQPLSARVDTFASEGEAAIRGAAETALEQIKLASVHAHARLDDDALAAVQAFDEDESATQQEVDVAGEQLELDLDTHIQDQEARFTDTAAAQADGYRVFAEGLAEGIAQLPFLPADQADQLVAEQEVALTALHQGNLDALDELARSTRESAITEIRGGIAHLAELVSQNRLEIEALRDEKVSALTAIGTELGASLEVTAGAVDVEMRHWADPLGGETQAYIAEIDAAIVAHTTASEQRLAQALGLYQGELATQVATFAQHIDPNPAAAGVEATLREICSESRSAMRGLGTDENRLFNALRRCDTATMGAAAEEMWGRMYSDGTLRKWIIEDCNESEQAIAFGYLAGRTAEAARLELESNMRWYGDDEAQIEAILRSLDPEQREQLRALPEWEATNARLQSNLDGTDLNVTNALIVGNDARADAYRLRDSIDEARRKGDHDALHTALSGMDPGRRAQIAQEFANIQSGVEASATQVPPVDQQAAYDALVGYATRDITQGQGRYAYTLSITGANRDLAEALIREGNDSLTADVARFEVERTRRGGPKEENMEQALLMSAEEQQILRDPRHPRHAEVVAAQRARSADFEAAWQERYGQAEGAPASVREALQQTYADHDHAELEVQAHQWMLEDGTNSPRVVAAATQLAIEGCGTDEERLARMWTGLTPDEADEAQALWRAEYSEDGDTLEERLFGGTFSELSGDEALDQRRRMLGDSQYFHGEHASRALALAELEYEYSAGKEGGWGIGAGAEEENVQRHYTDLQGLIADIERAQGGSAFGADGAFLGTPEQYARYQELCAFIGINAAHYRERVDSVATGVVAGIAIVGAVVATVLTAGAASPGIAAAASAFVTGAVGVGANAGLRGGRYGWEQAATDLGVTAVSAATAGAGVYLNKLNTVNGVSGGIFNASTQSGRIAGQVTVAAGTGFVNSAASTAMQDATWRDGFGEGIGETLYSGARGAAANAVSTGVGEGLKTTGLGRLTDSHEYLARGTGNAVVNAASGMSQRTVELSFDAASGRYTGEFSDAVLDVALEGAKSGGQGFLEGVGEASYERRKAARAQQEASETRRDGEEEGRALAPGEEESSRSTTSVEEETVARTQADPEVNEAITRIDEAEASASDRLEQNDQQGAAQIEDLNRRVLQGADESGGSSVSREQAQGELDGVEQRLLDTDRAAVHEAQPAHDDARAVIESAEARHRSDVEAERAALEEAGRQRSDQQPDAQAAPTRPGGEGAPSDLAGEGSRALSLSDDEARMLNSLDAAQMDQLRARVSAGEDARLVLSDLARGGAPDLDTGRSAPSGGVMSDDDILNELIRMERLGQIDDAGVDRVLAASSPEEMTLRLREAREASLQTLTERNEHYAPALADAQRTEDPVVRQALVDRVITDLDQAGQGQAVSALRALDNDPAAQLELAHHMAVYRGFAGRDATSLTDTEVVSLCHAHHAMLNRFGIGEADLRKVIGEGMVAGLLSMQDRSGAPVAVNTMGGSVADARNTEGLTPSQIVEVLGLDYQGSPYIVDDGQHGYTPVDNLFYLQAPVTPELASEVRVPLQNDVRSRMEVLAESDPVVRSVLERSLGRDPGEWGDPLDPYTGFGFTAPGPRLPGGQITLNQELILNDAPVPVGSQIFHQGPDGRSVPIATLVAGSDGGVHWAVSPDCPPELAPRFQQLAAQGQVNAQSAR